MASITSLAFRKYLFDQLSENMNEQTYICPSEMPVLHRFTKLEKYAVHDIINGKLTITSISAFNDIYDGVMHEQLVNDSLRSKDEEDWHLTDSIHNAAGVSLSEESKQAFFNMRKHNSYLSFIGNFDFLRRLGIYLCCFSEKNDSILMWSHYAASNTGICVSYDFNTMKEEFRNMLLPVAYSNHPVTTPNFWGNTNLNDFETEYNVYGTILTKNKTWDYEKEWRLIFKIPQETRRRMSINIRLKPCAISFGYHFLKPFFFYVDDHVNIAETNNRFDNVIELLKYMMDNNIKAYIMVPEIGEFNLKPVETSAQDLYDLITQIKKDKQHSLKTYSVVLREMLDILYEE